MGEVSQILPPEGVDPELQSTIPYDVIDGGFFGNFSFNGTGNDNFTFPAVDEYTLMAYYILWLFVAPTIFGIIIVVGTVGNTMVICVILKKPAMRTATNFLLLNMACSDIAFLILCVPLTAHRYAAATWPFGDAICKLVSFVIYVTAYVTVYTLVAISVLRYMTVVHSTCSARYRTKKNVIIVVLLLWVVTCAVNIPSILIHKVKIFDDHFSYCGLVDDLIKPFYLCFFVFGYALPLVLICLLYVIVIRHLNQARGSSVVDQTRERTLRASKIIVLVVATFVLSWLPLQINQLLSVFYHVPDGLGYEIVRILCNCMAYGNSCANPIIYNFASQDFKRGFRELLCCCNGRQQDSNRRSVTNGGVRTKAETVTMI